MGVAMPERREGYEDFAVAIRELAESNKIDRMKLEETQQQTKVIAEKVELAGMQAVENNLHLSTLSTGFDKLSENIERVTREAIAAKHLATDTAAAHQALTEETKMLTELVVRHDERILAHDKSLDGDGRTKLWIFGSSLLLLMVLFVMFYIDADAAKSAWDALSGGQ